MRNNLAGQRGNVADNAVVERGCHNVRDGPGDRRSAGGCIYQRAMATAYSAGIVGEISVGNGRGQLVAYMAGVAVIKTKIEGVRHGAGQGARVGCRIDPAAPSAKRRGYDQQKCNW